VHKRTSTVLFRKGASDPVTVTEPTAMGAEQRKRSPRLESWTKKTRSTSSRLEGRMICTNQRNSRELEGDERDGRKDAQMQGEEETYKYAWRQCRTLVKVEQCSYLGRIVRG